MGQTAGASSGTGQDRAGVVRGNDPSPPLIWTTNSGKLKECLLFCCGDHLNMFNRLGVAGDVLQTPLSLIQ